VEAERMNREDTKKYLQLLGQELQQRQVTGQILLADGIVMLLDVRKPEGRKDIKAYLQGDKSAIDIPKSIDAYFGSRGAAVRDAALVIAQREGLPHDWLQDTLLDFFFKQPGNEKWLEYPGLRVFLAPRAYVLAMKVSAAGSPQDIEDIKTLAATLGVTNVQGMLTYVKKYIPEELLTQEMRSRVEELFTT
jgi:hypothetical protein